MKTQTITVKTTTTEEIDIEFPIYLKESDSCIYALFSPTEIYEVNYWASLDRAFIYKTDRAIDGIYQICKGNTIKETDFMVHLLASKQAVLKSVSDIQDAWSCRNDSDDNMQDSTDAKELKYDKLEYDQITRAEVDR